MYKKKIARCISIQKPPKNLAGRTADWFVRDQAENYFLAFQRTEQSVWNNVSWLLQSSSKTGVVLLRKRKLNFSTLKQIYCSRPPEARTASPTDSLSEGEICQNMVVSSSPTSRSWLSKQSSGAGFSFRAARTWLLSAVVAEVSVLLVPMSTTSISFLGAASGSEKSRISGVPDKHRTGNVAWTALTVARSIK